MVYSKYHSYLLYKVEYVMVNFKSKPSENKQGGENANKLTNVRLAFQVESNQVQANCWSAKRHRTTTEME